MRRPNRRARRLVYKLGRFRLVEEHWTLPDGTPDIFPIVSSPSFSSVVALTDEHDVVLVRDLHPVPGLRLLELPGGRIEPGESPRAAARRELEEETGWRARRLVPLGSYYPNPHWGSYRGHLFLGTGLRAGTRHPDPGESLRPVLLPADAVYRRLGEGHFFGGSTLVGLFMAERHLRRRGWLTGRSRPRPSRAAARARGRAPWPVRSSRDGS
jgi:ADP-ribose pyrophosphatase